MGFLDGSTNSIILDTVLTDRGRELLARNDGSFNVYKFALSDDEVDYGVITRYGRTIGKEKIEKNTPIFEALTNSTHALKYKLITANNPNLLRLPTFSLSGDSNVNGTDSTITLGRSKQQTATVTIEQVIQNETTIDNDLRDDTFIVDMPNLFLEVRNDTPESVSGHRATYLLVRSSNENSYGGSILQFTLRVKSLTDTLFDAYGMTANKNRISTFVRVTGTSSGAVKDIGVIIDKTI